MTRHYAITWNSELKDVRAYMAEATETLDASILTEIDGRGGLVLGQDESKLRGFHGATLVALYNELAARSGVAPVKKFEDKGIACRRLFSRIEENAVLVEAPATMVVADYPPLTEGETNMAVKKKAKRRVAAKTKTPAVRDNTKQAQLITMLKRNKGATVAEIAEAFGWQAHTVRGMISGTLKKKLGLAVTSEKDSNRGRVYTLV